MAGNPRMRLPWTMNHAGSTFFTFLGLETSTNWASYEENSLGFRGVRILEAISQTLSSKEWETLCASSYDEPRTIDVSLFIVTAFSSLAFLEVPDMIVWRIPLTSLNADWIVWKPSSVTPFVSFIWPSTLVWVWVNSFSFTTVLLLTRAVELPSYKGPI